MTEIRNIIERFNLCIRDYTWADFYPSELDQIVNGYLLNSISYFEQTCQSDLTIQGDSIVGDLSDAEIRILVNGMVVEWLKPYVLSSDNFRNGMNTKDYSMFSPANLLKEIHSVYNEKRKERDEEIIQYSYDCCDLSVLPVLKRG